VPQVHAEGDRTQARRKPNRHGGIGGWWESVPVTDPLLERFPQKRASQAESLVGWEARRRQKGNPACGERTANRLEV
jgi:hypothetical protein